MGYEVRKNARGGDTARRFKVMRQTALSREPVGYGEGDTCSVEADQNDDGRDRCPYRGRADDQATSRMRDVGRTRGEPRNTRRRKPRCATKSMLEADGSSRGSR